MSYAFVVVYAMLTLAFGVLPALYAVELAFTSADGGFAGPATLPRWSVASGSCPRWHMSACTC
ncbi:hypothetical protein [Microbispora sp. NPDC049125]|uniref:hypothetical protein n=1 Tax=Microbispora sp. NPDC049125 TaxID=3154929 RepID=UPI0034674977